MRLYYVLVFAATFLFACQFLFNQNFQKKCGTMLSATLTFMIYTNAFGTIIMLMINRFQLEWSWFSVGMALIQTVCNILCTYAGMKALSIVNLAVFALFSMLGGMLLPFGYGIVFGNEPFTVIKAFCVVVITFALVLTVVGEKEIKKGWPYYLSVFILNGMTGVLTSIHQSYPSISVDSGSFTVWTRLISFVVCLAVQLIVKKKVIFIHGKVVLYSAGFALFNGMGNLFLLISVMYLSASVQYPIVTGGTIFFSTMISVVRKEKISVRTLSSTLLALTATVGITIL